MLDLLVKSVVRRKVVALFALNPDHELYPRQVAKEIDESPHAVGLELKYLTKGGLLETVERSGRTHYRWNPDYLFSTPLRNMVLTLRERHLDPVVEAISDLSWRQRIHRTLPRIVADLTKYYQPEKIVVFGSAATGRVRPFSDIDLFVVKETPRTPIKRLLDIARFLPNDMRVDCVVWTPQEVAAERGRNLFLREEILKKGKILYERSR